MTINRTRPKSDEGGIAMMVNQVTGDVSYLSDNINSKIFNAGGILSSSVDGGLGTGGLAVINESRASIDNGFGVEYGSWTIIPTRTFEADVKVWGAGGGSHSHGTERTAGGGGFSRATILFLENIPYTIWVGQGGFYSLPRYGTNGNKGTYRTAGTFGNGGGGGHAGGSGGGMSGVFFNTFGNDGGPGAGHEYGHAGSNDYGGVACIYRSPGQQNALIIAGGGGGQGSTGSHANGGGGGGTTGNAAHNAGAGTQTAGGAGGYNSAQAGQAFHGGFGGNGSHAGGGGGGWFGGGGGGHSGSHHDGGGGGSGHVLDLHSVSGYRNFWIKSTYPTLVTNGTTTTAEGSGNSVFRNAPANYNDPDWNFAGVGAGPAQWASNPTNMMQFGHWNNWRSGTNGRVVIKVTG